MSKQKDQPQLIIRNSSRILRSQSSQKPQGGSSFPLIHPRASSSVNERLLELQSNLKFLERQYRNNLKDGFDKKIKAYRLEAVMERRVMKDALKASQKQKSASEVQERLRMSSEKSALLDSRVLVMRNERERSRQAFLERKKRESSSLQLSISETKAGAERRAKEMHDRVVEEEGNQNRKREYFEELRREGRARAEEELKRRLLDNIISNTGKLKGMKSTLDELMAKQPSQDLTFVTI